MHAGGNRLTAAAAGAARSGPLTEPRLVRYLLIGLALAFLGFFLVVPLALVFVKGFADGWKVYLDAVRDPVALSAVRLTLLAAACAVPVNLLFGLAAAWGKNILITLIDLPFAVSPVIAGMVFVLLFGAHGLLGPLFQAHEWKVIFALPGIVLATIFVTSPLIARELIPLMQAQGNEEEAAAVTLGASGWQTFRLISLPKIKWGLLYGIVLCNARAMGEFGAVSVVSGHIRGLTNTLPLHVEILYNEYQFTAAFAVASLLTLLALVTLLLKTVIEWRSAH